MCSGGEVVELRQIAVTRFNFQELMGKSQTDKSSGLNSRIHRQIAKVTTHHPRVFMNSNMKIAGFLTKLCNMSLRSLST